MNPGGGGGGGENDDFDLEKELEAYLEPPGDPNPDMVGVRVEWVEEDPRLGSEHMWIKHHVTQEEVEQVLFETPPRVESKRSPDYPERTILKPITAFEPEEGEAYWRRQ